jgi:hypothetical protein
MTKSLYYCHFTSHSIQNFEIRFFFKYSGDYQRKIDAVYGPKASEYLTLTVNEDVPTCEEFGILNHK